MMIAIHHDDVQRRLSKSGVRRNSRCWDFALISDQCDQNQTYHTPNLPSGLPSICVSAHLHRSTVASYLTGGTTLWSLVTNSAVWPRGVQQSS